MIYDIVFNYVIAFFLLKTEGSKMHSAEGRREEKKRHNLKRLYSDMDKNRFWEMFLLLFGGSHGLSG